MRRLKGHGHDFRAHGLDNRPVAVIGGFDQDRLVAGVQEAHQAVGQGLGGAGGDHDFGLPVDIEAVEAPVGGGDGLAQRGHAHHRRILVGAVHDRPGGDGADIVGALVVGEALAEIDGAMLGGQRRHGGEDGRAQTRKYPARRPHRPRLFT